MTIVEVAVTWVSEWAMQAMGVAGEVYHQVLCCFLAWEILMRKAWG